MGRGQHHLLCLEDSVGLSGVRELKPNYKAAMFENKGTGPLSCLMHLLPRDRMQFLLEESGAMWVCPRGGRRFAKQKN